MDIPTLRKQIDHIDYQLLDLLARRIGVVQKIGRLKKEHGIPARNNERWQELLADRIAYGTKHQIPAERIHQIWTIIHDWAVSIEQSV